MSVRNVLSALLTKSTRTRTLHLLHVHDISRQLTCHHHHHHHHHHHVHRLKSTSRFLSVSANDNDNDNDNNNDDNIDTSTFFLSNDANLSPLTVDNPTWDDNLAALCEYRDRHGTVNIPDRSSHYPQLGRFVYNLRRQKSLLTQIQKQQLDELGFLWESSLDAKRQQQWEDMFARLVAFQQEHGHCVVPQQYEKDPPLGIWVMNQRSRWKLSELETSSQAALTEDQRDRLAAIGFVVRLRPGGARKQTKFEQRWNLRFQELLAYQEEHGDCNVPLTFVKNKKLANWVHTQRQYHKKGQLRWDRYQALCDIGFTWDFAEIHDESWHRRYKQVKTYYEQLQQYKLQSDTSKLPLPTLSDRAKVWKDNQRRAHASGYLDPDRKALLDEIEGFEWRQE